MVGQNHIHIYKVGQNRIYTPYMTVYLVNFYQKYHIYTVYIWFWPTVYIYDVCTVVLAGKPPIIQSYTVYGVYIYIYIYIYIWLWPALVTTSQGLREYILQGAILTGMNELGDVHYRVLCSGVHPQTKLPQTNF
jgi:hypothetical protein